MSINVVLVPRPIRRSVYAGLLVAAIAGGQGCGSSTGGAPQAKSATETGGGTGGGTGTLATTGTGTGAQTLPATGGQTGTDTGIAAAAGGADPTDAQICAFLGAQSGAVLAHFAQGTAYLCTQGGLATLRAAAGKLQTLQNSTDAGGVSHFALAAAILAKGSPFGAEKLTHLFCTNNAQYQADVGAAAFTNVASITPSNVTAAGCDFDFKSTAVVIIQPEYIGTQQFIMSSDQAVGIGFSYLTKNVSYVNDSTTLSIAAKSNGEVYVYSVLSSAAPTAGFASVVYDALVKGTTASMQGSAQAIATLSQ